MAEESQRSLWSSLRASLGGRRAEVDAPPQPPEHVPVAILYVDADKNVVSANPAAIDLADLPEDRSWVGAPIARWIPEADALAALRPARKRAGLWIHELQLRRPNDALVPVEVTEAPVEGTALTAITLSDLTEQRRRLGRLTRANERLAAARDDSIEQSRAKTLTMARIAEVLRTPLSAIIGYAELMVEDARDAGDTDMVSDVQRILDSSGALLAILRNVLDLSEIEVGRMRVLQARVDVDAELIPLVERTKAQARARGNTVSFARLAEVGDAWADRERVLQILDVLLDNANRYTEDGMITVRAMREPVADQEHIVIEISDTGVGMEEEQLEHIFDHYGRGATTRGATGAGIGLVVSAALARLMEGNLTVVSRPGVGSTFTLRLPAFSVQHDIHPPMLTATGLPVPRRKSQGTVQVAVREEVPRAHTVASLDRGGWVAELVDVDSDAIAQTAEVVLVVGPSPGDDPVSVVERARSASPNRPIVVLAPPGLDDAVRRQLEPLASAVLLLSPDAERGAWDEALHGAIMRSVMMGAMRRRLGPVTPSLPPTSLST